jgi:hypothetical protein
LCADPSDVKTLVVNALRNRKIEKRFQVHGASDPEKKDIPLKGSAENLGGCPNF